LLALVTGGSPRSHGLFYDYSYDRTIWPPDHNGCSGAPGTQMIFDESIDVYVNNVSQNVIDPNALPFYRDAAGNCVRMYPHDALRVNTVFEVISPSTSATRPGQTSTPRTTWSMGPRARALTTSTRPKLPMLPGSTTP
jgi:hypothetical protein